MSGDILGLHVRRSAALAVWWTVPVSFLLVAPGTLTHNLRLWGELPAAIGYITVLVGPVAAAVAAWEAGREGRDGMAVVAAGARPALVRVLARVGAACLVLLAAYLVTAVVVVLVFVVQDARGPAGWGPLALGAAGITAWCAVGAMAGAAWSGRWVPVAVAVGAYLIQAFAGAYWPRLVSFQDGASALAPYPGGLAALQSSWTLLVAAAGTAGTAAMLIHSPARRRIPLAAIGLSLLLAVPVAGAVTSYPIAAPAADPRACARTSPVVCVDPVFEAALPSLASQMERSFAPLTAVGVAPTRVEQGTADRVGDGDLIVPLYSVNDRFDAHALALAAVTRWVVGEPCWEPDADRDVVQGVLDWALAGDPSTPATGGDGAVVAAALTDADASARGSWLRTNWDAIHSCRPTPPVP